MRKQSRFCLIFLSGNFSEPGAARLRCISTEKKEMRIILAIILLTVFSFAVFAQTNARNAKLVAEAQAFEKELIGALRKGDRDALERMLGEGFIFIHSTGPLETREEYLKNSSSGNLLLQRTEFENFDETWRIFEGNTAIHYSRTVMRNKAANTENRLRNISVYVKTAAKGWQCVSGQSTKLPVRPKATAIDARLSDDYAGVYQISAERTFTVTKENDVLYGLTTGRSKFELVPTSDTTFVFFNENNDPGFLEAVFTRDASGKPTEVFLRSNGQETWRAKRVK